MAVKNTYIRDMNQTEKVTWKNAASTKVGRLTWSLLKEAISDYGK